MKPSQLNLEESNSLRIFNLYCGGRFIFYHHYHHPAWLRTELQRVYRDTRMMGIDWAMGADRVTGVMEGLSNGQYIFTRLQGIYHLVLYCLIIQSLTHSIFLILWSHLLIPRFCEFSESDSIITSPPHPTFLQAELHVVTNSFSNAPRGTVKC